MESGHSTTKLTYADLVLFPEDGLRHEIIDGEHYVTPSPGTRHQRISGRLFNHIQNYLHAHPLGEVFYAPFDTLLGEFDIVEPDLGFISNERAGFVTPKNVQGPPDLVIEIFSPSTKSRDKRLKRDLYERAGVREYWLVDPDDDVIQVYRRDADAFTAPVEFRRTDILTSPLFAGLELPLDRIFA